MGFILLFHTLLGSMTHEEIKKYILQKAVNNIRTFGYPDANEENIMTDVICAPMFKVMLEGHLHLSNTQTKTVIYEILSKINV